MTDRQKGHGPRRQSNVEAEVRASRASPAAQRLPYPDDFRAALREEHAISGELFAAGYDLLPRVRLIGIEQWSVTLPPDQFDAGRVLLALRTLALLAMTKAVIVCTPEPSGFDIWTLTTGGALGQAVICDSDPTYRVVDMREFRDDLQHAPPLALSLSPLLLPGPGHVSQLELDRVREILGPTGLYPATQLNTSPSRDPSGSLQLWTH